MIDEEDFVSAYSEDDAWSVWEQETGFTREDHRLHRIVDDSMLSVWCEGDGEPADTVGGKLSAAQLDDGAKLVSRTAAEWALLCGRGMAFSTQD